jgi:hypothetical protein
MTAATSTELSRRPVGRRSNIFICFAEAERDFVRELDEALRRRRRVSSIDWNETAGERDVTARIENAETFIFIVSPSSLASADCLRQLDRAARLKKIIVPIVRVPVAEKSRPALPASIPAIDFRAELDFAKAFELVIKAVNTNLRIDVFICYAREDGDFVRRLYKELVRTGRNVWLDVSSIPTSTLWEEEIYSGIEASDNFVFIISADSVSAESFCHKELARAFKHNKRIIPLYHREADAAQIPPQLAQYQRRDFPAGGDFEANFQQLVSDLEQNPVYLREHTRLLTRAIEWQRSDGDKSLLLRGLDLTHAENLLRSSAGIEPQFTNLQTQYVLESRADANSRRKKTMGAIVSALCLTSLLSVGLFFQTRAANAAREEAEERRREAERQVLISQARELILGSEANIKKDAQLSLLLAVAAAEKSVAAEGRIDARSESLLHRLVFAAVPHLPTGTGGIESLAWKHDGSALAAGSSDGKVVIISAADRQITDTFDAHGWIESVDWNDDALLAIATRADYGSTENKAIIWDVARKKEAGQIDLPDQATSVSWRKNTRQIAIALARGDKSVVKVFDWTSSQPKELFEAPGIRGVWSPDGKLLATGGGGGDVHLFDAEGRSLGEIAGHERYVHQIAWTSDSKRFATASVDDRVIVWDAGGRLGKLKVLPAEFALGVAWSPDNSRLASGSGQNLVTVWDGNTYELIFEFTRTRTITGDEILGTGAQGYVLDVEWNPEGSLMAASERGDYVSEGGSVLLFPTSMFQPSMNAAAWLELAKSMLTRSLTREECREYLHQDNCGNL